MSDQKPDEVLNSLSEFRHIINDEEQQISCSMCTTMNYNVPLISDLRVLLDNGKSGPECCTTTIREAGNCSNEILHGLLSMEKGESSGRTRNDEDTPKEDHKPKKRQRCSEAHNLDERVRRQRLKEKMDTLHELIPSCDKKDKASTLDGAIKYIKALQLQLQMVSMRAGFMMMHYPPQMMSWHSVPVPTFSPFLNTESSSATRTTMSSQLGSPCYLCSLAPSTTSGLQAVDGVSQVLQSFQNPGDVLQPVLVMPTTSSDKAHVFTPTTSSFL